MLLFYKELHRSSPLSLSTLSFSLSIMVAGVQILAKNQPKVASEILNEDALSFLAALHRTFDGTRQDLLNAREVAQQRYDSGVALDFPSETAHIRNEPSWICAPPAPGLEDRRVEITGPPDRKMVINALNSGAKTFMADFEGTRLKLPPLLPTFPPKYGNHIPSYRVHDSLTLFSYRLVLPYFREPRQRSGQSARRHSSPDRL